MRKRKGSLNDFEIFDFSGKKVEEFRLYRAINIGTDDEINYGYGCLKPWQIENETVGYKFNRKDWTFTRKGCKDGYFITL